MDTTAVQAVQIVSSKEIVAVIEAVCAALIVIVPFIMNLFNRMKKVETATTELKTATTELKNLGITQEVNKK